VVRALLPFRSDCALRCAQRTRITREARDMNWDSDRRQVEAAQRSTCVSTWGDLTDDDLDKISGKRDRLAGLVQGEVRRREGRSGAADRPFERDLDARSDRTCHPKSGGRTCRPAGLPPHSPSGQSRRTHHAATMRCMLLRDRSRRGSARRAGRRRGYPQRSVTCSSRSRSSFCWLHSCRPHTDLTSTERI
jgi:hypothetical protein